CPHRRASSPTSRALAGSVSHLLLDRRGRDEEAQQKARSSSPEGQDKGVVAERPGALSRPTADLLSTRDGPGGPEDGPLNPARDHVTLLRHGTPEPRGHID